MACIAYVNGRFVRQSEACVRIEDRGFLFADGVYEVWPVLAGRLADANDHFARLERSLSELRIAMPMSRAALTLVLGEAVRRNRVRDGRLYLQVTRGAAPRDHGFPSPPVTPSLVVMVRPVDLDAAEARAERGVAVVTTPETRWARCDIKSVALLPNVLAIQAAREAGAQEAWFVDALGLVTEGGSSNAWIVDAGGTARTRDLNANILRGVTRAALMRLMREEGVAVSERPFTVDEAKAAREAFITSAAAFVTGVVRIDGTAIGDGRPGPLTRRLRALYLSHERAPAP